MLPRVDSAMKELRAYGVYDINKEGCSMERKPTFSVVGPNRFRKYNALQKEMSKTIEQTILSFY
jgi:hypothetical protein